MTAEQMDTECQSGQRVINLVSKPIDQEVPRLPFAQFLLCTLKPALFRKVDHVNRSKEKQAGMKRAAVYTRVSTVDQHPETQLNDLRQMAAQRGYQTVAEYTDKISGTKARRPGLDQMMTDGRRGRFDVVLVWTCDRIARSTRHFLAVLDDLNRTGVEFVSFRENIDTGGPLGRAIVIIIAEPQSPHGAPRRSSLHRHRASSFKNASRLRQFRTSSFSRPARRACSTP
jgi:hypothetical protein